MKKINLTIYFWMLIHMPLTIAQTCYTEQVEETPISRYTIYADLTALDYKTDLIWMRCLLGQTSVNGTCKGSATPYKWQDALVQAEKVVFAGKDDWRLPNIKELQSLLEHRCSPAISPIFLSFTPTNHAYWSSSLSVSKSNGAWGVEFNSGGTGEVSQDALYYVRLVRGGQ